MEFDSLFVYTLALLMLCRNIFFLQPVYEFYDEYGSYMFILSSVVRHLNH